MRRRTFLEIAGGLLVSALPRAQARAATGDRVGIVGAGILGASIADALARRGARVTVFERGEPARGTTGRSFGWLNAHFTKQPHAFYLLNRLGVLTWRELDDELGPALGVQWGGAVEWTGTPETDRDLREGVGRLLGWGSSIRLIDAARLRVIEPGVTPGPVLSASHAGDEGAVDGVAATRSLLARARAAGAELRTTCEVTAIDLRDGRLRGVRTSQGTVELDRLVLASGVEISGLARHLSLEVPLRPAPGLIVRTPPMPRLLNGVVVGPLVHARQDLDGRIVLGEDPGPPAGDVHAHLSAGPQDFQDDDVRDRHARRLVTATARFVPALEGAPVEQLLLGWRPLPRDGHPVVGVAPRCPDVYVAVTHSGVTLGPLLGRLASIEILDGVRTNLLQPFRPDRF